MADGSSARATTIRLRVRIPSFLAVHVLNESSVGRLARLFEARSTVPDFPASVSVQSQLPNGEFQLKHLHLHPCPNAHTSPGQMGHSITRAMVPKSRRLSSLCCASFLLTIHGSSRSLSWTDRQHGPLIRAQIVEGSSLLKDIPRII